MNLLARIDLSRLAWHRAARLAPLVAWGLALSVSAWVAVDLFWRYAAPRPAALPVTPLIDPQQAARAVAGRHLMGRGAETGPTAVLASPGRYTLQAVVTGGQGRPGWAIIATDGGAQQGYVEGQEISPGLMLSRISADSVELGSGPARQIIKLADRPVGGTPDNPGNPNTTPPPGATPMAQITGGEPPAQAGPAIRHTPAGQPALPQPSQ